ncbi:MAG: PaaI family thioesterase, partial [Gammaproteobacteria bacterium]
MTAHSRPGIAPDSNFQQLLGYELTQWRDGHAVVELHMDERHRNRTGRLHGGVAVTLLDTACGYAGCYSADGAPPRYCITLSLNTSFVAATMGGPLRAIASVIGGGRRIFFAR